MHDKGVTFSCQNIWSFFLDIQIISKSFATEATRMSIRIPNSQGETKGGGYEQ